MTFSLIRVLTAEYIRNGSNNSFYSKFNTATQVNESIHFSPIPVAARSKAWVYGRSLAGIVGSNPTGGMDVCVVFVVQGLVWIISDMKDGRI
jgi:hypothetical protein